MARKHAPIHTFRRNGILNINKCSQKSPINVYICERFRPSNERNDGGGEVTQEVESFSLCLNSYFYFNQRKMKVGLKHEMALINDSKLGTMSA